MPTAHDVATYVLKQKGPFSAMKLQKLVYYCQAWSLVWEDRRLYPERIEAWANGPVLPELYRYHRGDFLIHDWRWGSAGNLNDDERETVDTVLAFYGDKSPQWLSDLTHAEQPWRRARERAGVEPGEWCDEEITLADMAEYYGSLTVEPAN